MADRSRWLQSRYGDQTSHTRIAAPESIAAAKKKRAEQRRAAALALQRDEPDDYIPLDISNPTRSVVAHSTSLDTYAGPHPESGLQREEDDLGSGEDEHAEFTGATERIPLGRDAERKRRQQRRRQMQSLIAEATGAPNEEEDIAVVVREQPRQTQAAPHTASTTILEPTTTDFDQILVREEDHEEQEEQDAWEAAQLNRSDMPGIRESTSEHEPPPHRPVPIPLTAPVPTPTSCLARLEKQMSSLNERANQEEQHRIDTENALASLDQHETQSRTAVEAAEAKLAWFAELENFVETFAVFLDVKMPLIDTLEHNALALLVDRKISREHARMLAIEDAISLFHGVSKTPLCPSHKNQDVATMDRDGPGNSPVRESRRSQMHCVSDISTQRLSHEEIEHFRQGRDELAKNVEDVLLDTNAPEFRSPLAADENGVWHPRSIAARFHAWRSTYPGEYDLAWGGLALAATWQIFARLELVQWDPLWCTGRDVDQDDICLTGPRSGLEGFTFEHEINLYLDADARERNKGRGGDSEASTTLISNVVVPRLISVAEEAYDIWSATETKAALSLLEQISYLMDASSWQIKSLVRAFLTPFQTQIDRLETALGAPKIFPGLAMHPDVPKAREFIAQELGLLAVNLGRWAICYHGSHALQWSVSERSTYDQLLDRLLGKILWPILVEAGAFGGTAVAKRILSECPLQNVESDVRSNYKALASNNTL
ncbi:hypothetical protein MYAM1_001011 [Malassezia yamatoensis]|uniref:GCF C-terminal domain-containing protein n=1 Tax=Malassezia yamatoensis TaxID=253288 RepID=A0AAJ5YT34_9BASI|nr:hypothetical protein MYAM1_001011 [Malassezia yamatoensis]